MENLDVNRGLFIVSTEIGTRYVLSGPDPASPTAARPAKAEPRADDRCESCAESEPSESTSLELWPS